MTLHNTALSLFASTVACGLGLALTVSSSSAVAHGSGTSTPLIIGLALMLLGSAVFLGVGSRDTRDDAAMLKVVLGALGAGVLTVWFWLVPAQVGVVTVACHYDNFGACERIMEGGGFPASVAISNDDFVTRQCEVGADARLCRLAAARRLSHPSRFCPNIEPSEAFEVVEWCTPNQAGDLLVARR